MSPSNSLSGMVEIDFGIPPFSVDSGAVPSASEVKPFKLNMSNLTRSATMGMKRTETNMRKMESASAHTGYGPSSLST